jgi:hypothetical protein
MFGESEEGEWPSELSDEERKIVHRAVYAWIPRAGCDHDDFWQVIRIAVWGNVLATQCPVKHRRGRHPVGERTKRDKASL